MDQVRERLDLPGTLLAVRRLSARWPEAHLKLVEDKANGPAVVQSLRHEIAGIVEVNPQGGKSPVLPPPLRNWSPATVLASPNAGTVG